MVRMGKLSIEELRKYLGFGKYLVRDQNRVSFLRAEAVVREAGQKARIELVSVIKLIRGWDTANFSYFSPKEPRPLPFESDTDLEGAAQKLGARGPFWFELSRCVNAGAADVFRFQFQFAVLQAAYDTIERGGQLEDAYLFAHTIVPETAQRVFEPLGMKIVHQTAGGHSLLRGSIRDLLNHLNPEAQLFDLATFERQVPLREEVSLATSAERLAVFLEVRYRPQRFTSDPPYPFMRSYKGRIVLPPSRPSGS